MPRCMWCQRAAAGEVVFADERGKPVTWLACLECRPRAFAAAGNRVKNSERPMPYEWRPFLPGVH